MSDSREERTSGPALPAGDTQGGVPGAGLFGTYLLVVSLAMLFAASMVGYLVIRGTHLPWPPPGFPVLPRSLWLSTLVIVLSSVAIQRALGAVRQGNHAGVTRWLASTFVLGLLFLGLQTAAWWQIVAQIASPSQNAGPYLKLFYVLTGLHAAHVVGGLIPLGIVTRRAAAGRYGPNDHSGVRCSAVYWHFLDAVWCALFVVVYLL